ncbi:MAG: bifunctional pyr operon transcriptional regulator/uracil phosphoribosyltransferase PyrR [Bacteroidetes bacterium]|nr:MAG: bifunctional pyr operon transcriptional regulator/uracil phosphoribosyltransferase PyrR [Bacteroidota bacterium]
MNKILIDNIAFNLIIKRLCFELVEHHKDFANTVLIGIQPRGTHFCTRITQKLKEIRPNINVISGALDVTFYRDDFRRREKPLEPSKTDIPFMVENKKVVLIDDVLYTGRTIRAAMDAILDFGRPEKIELLTLIDRRFSRHVPVQPDYVGKTVDVVANEIVRVEWKEYHGKDQIILLNKPE